MEIREFRRGRVARAWGAVTHVGVPPLGVGDFRAVVATNQFLVLALIVAVPYLAFFLVHWGDSSRPATTTLVAMACWALAIGLNARRLYSAAATIALGAFEVQIANLTHFYTANSGFQYLLFAGALLSFVLFRPGDVIARFAFLVLSVGLVLWSEVAWTSTTGSAGLSSLASTVVLVVNVLLAVFLLYVVARFDMLYYERERRRNAELLDAAQVAAQTDALTDVYNRRGIAPVLSAVARRGEYTLALVDLDRFKLVNDRLGHGAGDVVLSNAARTLVKSVGEDGVVARWGGEEFLVVIPGLSLEEADALMERARADMESEYGSPDSLARVTISIGLAHAPRFAGKEEALRLADANLYEAKSSGRNLVVSGRLASVDRD